MRRPEGASIERSPEGPPTGRPAWPSSPARARARGVAFVAISGMLMGVSWLLLFEAYTLLGAVPVIAGAAGAEPLPSMRNRTRRVALAAEPLT